MNSETPKAAAAPTPAVAARSARERLIADLKNADSAFRKSERLLDIAVFCAEAYAAHASPPQPCGADCTMVHNIECPNRRQSTEPAPPSGSSPSAEPLLDSFCQCQTSMWQIKGNQDICAICKKPKYDDSFSAPMMQPPPNVLSADEQEVFDRVKLMASGDEQWDLSENDCKALNIVLHRLAAQPAPQSAAALPARIDEAIWNIRKLSDDDKHWHALSDVWKLLIGELTMLHAESAEPRKGETR